MKLSNEQSLREPLRRILVDYWAEDRPEDQVIDSILALFRPDPEPANDMVAVPFLSLDRLRKFASGQ